MRGWPEDEEMKRRREGDVKTTMGKGEREVGREFVGWGKLGKAGLGWFVVGLVVWLDFLIVGLDFLGFLGWFSG